MIQHILVDCLQLAHQRLLLPQNIRCLLIPVIALGAELDIKVIQDLGNHKAHLVVCHAKPTVSLLSTSNAY
jgi:hypothetical protein